MYVIEKRLPGKNFFEFLNAPTPFLLLPDKKDAQQTDHE